MALPYRPHFDMPTVQEAKDYVEGEPVIERISEAVAQEGTMSKPLVIDTWAAIDIMAALGPSKRPPVIFEDVNNISPHPFLGGMMGYSHGISFPGVTQVGNE